MCQYLTSFPSKCKMVFLEFLSSKFAGLMLAILSFYPFYDPLFSSSQITLNFSPSLDERVPHECVASMSLFYSCCRLQLRTTAAGLTMHSCFVSAASAQWQHRRGSADPRSGAHCGLAGRFSSYPCQKRSSCYPYGAS